MLHNQKPPRTLFLLFLLLFAGNAARAQSTVSVKNNLLYDATLTPNIGIEATLGERSSVQLFYGLNPWNGYHGLKKLQHWALMPEYRYWLNPDKQDDTATKRLTGWFTGVHLLGGEYNIGGIKLPFGLFKPLRHNHYEGWFAGAGLTIGHAWKLSDHWNLEAALGVGYIHIKYNRYANEWCGDLLGRGHYNYVGPTKLALNVAYVFGKKSEPVAVLPPEPAVVLPPPVYEPDYRLAYRRPVAEQEKARELNGQAFLDFVVNTTDIRRDYRGNAQELAKVEQTINEVRLDPNTTIRHIDIHGYASPEGSLQSNTRLAQGRAQAFRDYVQSLISLPADIFTVTSTPEDWQGLTRYLDTPRDYLGAQQEAIRTIAASDAEPDQKERLLKRQYGAQWRQLVQQAFPALRHSDYRVSYTIRPFTVDEARELIRTKPQQLSLNEMFLVANTYAPGSQEYSDVFETAVRMYPADETANLNAAVNALQRGDQTTAMRYIAKAGNTAEAQNVRGILSARQGDLKTAEAYLNDAQRQGLDAAAHNLGELQKVAASK